MIFRQRARRTWGSSTPSVRRSSPVYANDHLPPHFHILHPDFEALIVIETFATYAGSLKGTAGRDAMSWAVENIQAIKTEWNRVNPRWPIQ
ncbi:DUF4160 domain-containing protein [Bradyrhizobium ontarionense]|uniref:DUF4160 domain-containing protein n=1 Tax=Bradyrhizobium ontarionense TaxID=2898149 RepID=A0ABY3RB66_9BRAD|nr:DUF4160 domain-containing protein [Bradyrhizobium sp. A19]UFZ04615.1 DUF4160 domain-containing protein [Bradyrhizobium sp. A19]